MTTLAIRTEHLRKCFNSKVAVADLTLSVEPGEVFGFLGPNGAGKTTSVKMLLGLIAPTSGEARLFDLPAGDPRGRARVGFLPEHFRFHEWLTGAEFLRLHASLYRIPRRVADQRIPQLLERVGLSAHADKKLQAYSKGMLQRIGLAQALLNEPELVLLDEPTSGLDPVGRRLVRDLIRELRERGTAVFLNSHLLSEVEVTCDRVAFVTHGQIVRTAKLDPGTGQLLDAGELLVELRVRLPGGVSSTDAHATPRWEEILAGLSRWGQAVEVHGERIRLSVADEGAIPQIARYLLSNGLDLYALSPQRTSLEDLFMQLVGADTEV